MEPPPAYTEDCTLEEVFSKWKAVRKHDHEFEFIQVKRVDLFHLIQIKYGRRYAESGRNDFR